jgi:hypothetical protein
MDQEVKYIKIKDLVLWTENPRDPINENATDQDIVNKAFNDKLSKWNLDSLAKEMGGYYDFSELPTVVYHGDKPVVYDGNRRIILGKIKHGFVVAPTETNIKIPNFPEEIPCNVCTEKIGINNVYRKHSGAGSWQPLERDNFLYKFMGEQKSAFLVIDEDTGIISANPHLNQVFVKNEIFNEENLKKLGFTIEGGRINSVHNDDESLLILADISQKVKKKEITTRKNRGKVVEVLDLRSQQLIEKNKNNKVHPYKSDVNIAGTNGDEGKRQSKRTNKKEGELFGCKLYLNAGDVSDLYRDIVDLYQFYVDNKNKLSQSFSGLIRMSLRLLCETAANEQKKKTDQYLRDNFDDAKKTLSQDDKTTLAAQNVSKESIVQLLQAGAHSYKSAKNIEQTIAMSIVVGSIITITHGMGK